MGRLQSKLLLIIQRKEFWYRNLFGTTFYTILHGTGDSNIVYNLAAFLIISFLHHSKVRHPTYSWIVNDCSKLLIPLNIIKHFPKKQYSGLPMRLRSSPDYNFKELNYFFRYINKSTPLTGSITIIGLLCLMLLHNTCEIL